MLYKRTTQVPNFIFDKHLPDLTEAELKLLLIVTRQTLGWLNTNTGKRKSRDRITISQFIKKTGLAKRTVTKAIESLSQKKLIQVTDFQNRELANANERKGKSRIYYALYFPVHLTTPTSAQKIPEPVHQTFYNKTNTTKTTPTKLSHGNMAHIGSVLTQNSKSLFQTI